MTLQDLLTPTEIDQLVQDLAPGEGVKVVGRRLLHGRVATVVRNNRFVQTVIPYSNYQKKKSKTKRGRRKKERV
jgi:hypothetical protein